MSGAAPQAREAPALRLRMRELEARSGLSRETIRYYIAEGLLPEGEKTARNMAWYGAEHLRRLTLIQQLQEEHFLPLKAIRTILAQQPQHHFSAAQTRVLAAVRRQLHSEQAKRAPQAESVGALRARLPISEDDWRAIVASGHVELDAVEGEDYVGPEDVELLESWAQLRQAGLSAERGFHAGDLDALQTVVELLLNQELALFEARLQDLREEEGQAVFASIIPAINRIFGVLHARAARRFVETHYAAGNQESA